MELDIFSLLRWAVNAGASDIHLAASRPPMMRVHGEVVVVDPDLPVLTKDTCKDLIYSILYDDQRVEFEERYELDCSFEIPKFSRFRVNVHLQNNGIGAVMRVIEDEIPSAEFLGIGPELLKLTDLPRGLILVTGPTGSGKTNTLACMLNHINVRRQEHILTIEDPIEFVHKEEQCVITQRELSKSTKSFSNALRAALRQDPDVILVGEMRDLETISLALTAAETGHLVFGTLHTTDAAQTVARIVDVFPSGQQQMVQSQLAGSLKAVVSQTLMPRCAGGRVAAREVLMVDSGVAAMIRDGKTHQIYGMIDVGKDKGMISLERSLERLVRDGTVSFKDAVNKANRPDNLVTFLTDVLDEVSGGTASATPKPGSSKPAPSKETPPGGAAFTFK